MEVSETGTWYVVRGGCGRAIQRTSHVPGTTYLLDNTRPGHRLEDTSSPGALVNQQALTKSAIASTLLQVAMVLVNHFAPTLFGPNLPAIGGTAIGGVAGIIYGMLANSAAPGPNAGGGAAAGAIGGVLGSALSMAMGDVPAATIAIAGGSTAVSGAIGGVLGRLLGPKG